MFLMGGVSFMMVRQDAKSKAKRFAALKEDGTVSSELTQTIKNDQVPLSVGTLPDQESMDSETETVEIVKQELGIFGTEYMEWDRNQVYLGGSLAVYQGKIYKAKWWTQGETPGDADVWEDTKAVPDLQEESNNQSQYGSSTAEKKPVQKSTDKKVVGYFPEWKAGQMNQLRYDVLTHVVYAFAIPTAQGGLLPLENPDAARALIKEAHENQVQVLLAVGGWSYHDTPLEAAFVSATESREKLTKFADAILAMCEEYGFDGIDMDWEHPRVDGGSWAQYEELMIYLAERLHQKGKVLTSAVIGGVTADGYTCYDGAAHTDAVLAAVDWIHVMAYDGGDGQRHSSYDFAVNCGNYWKNDRKLPGDKIVLGVPFYGRPGWITYGDILAADSDGKNKDIAVINGMEVHYNGMETIKNKTIYAAEQLGGIMVWEVTQDTKDVNNSLMTAIQNGLAEWKASGGA